jgi:hypothetical protein
MDMMGADSQHARLQMTLRSDGDGTEEGAMRSGQDRRTEMLTVLLYRLVGTVKETGIMGFWIRQYRVEE